MQEPTTTTTTATTEALTIADKTSEPVRRVRYAKRTNKRRAPEGQQEQTEALPAPGGENKPSDDDLSSDATRPLKKRRQGRTDAIKQVDDASTDTVPEADDSAATVAANSTHAPADAPAVSAQEPPAPVVDTALESTEPAESNNGTTRNDGDDTAASRDTTIEPTGGNGAGGEVNTRGDQDKAASHAPEGSVEGTGEPRAGEAMEEEERREDEEQDSDSEWHVAMASTQQSLADDEYSPSVDDRSDMPPGPPSGHPPHPTMDDAHARDIETPVKSSSSKKQSKKRKKRRDARKSKRGRRSAEEPLIDDGELDVPEPPVEHARSEEPEPMEQGVSEAGDGDDVASEERALYRKHLRLVLDYMMHLLDHGYLDTFDLSDSATSLSVCKHPLPVDGVDVRLRTSDVSVAQLFAREAAAASRSHDGGPLRATVEKVPAPDKIMDNYKPLLDRWLDVLIIHLAPRTSGSTTTMPGQIQLTLKSHLDVAVHGDACELLCTLAGAFDPIGSYSRGADGVERMSPLADIVHRVGDHQVTRAALEACVHAMQTCAFQNRRPPQNEQGTDTSSRMDVDSADDFHVNPVSSNRAIMASV